MSRFSEFIKDGGWGVLVPICIIVFFVFSVRDCVRKEKITNSKYEAYRDSVERILRIQQEQLKAECEANREQFFNDFKKYYDFFASKEELDEWLDLYANPGSMEMLHYMYSSKTGNFSGEGGVEAMSNYLFVDEPVFWVECDECGNEIEFWPY